MTCPITGREVTKAVKQFLGGRVSGVDECGGGVVPGTAVREGWCSELKGQCQGGWRDWCTELTNEVSPL